MSDEHTITLITERRLDGQDWYRAVCTCGYRSGLNGYPGRAEQAGHDHAKAKNGDGRG